MRPRSYLRVNRARFGAIIAGVADRGMVHHSCGVRRVVDAGTVDEASVEKYRNGDHFYFASGPTSHTSPSDLLLTFRCAPGMNL
jgi:hypothetical protein